MMPLSYDSITIGIWGMGGVYDRYGCSCNLCNWDSGWDGDWMAMDALVTVSFIMRNVVTPEELPEGWTFEEYVTWIIANEGIASVIDDYKILTILRSEGVR